LPLSDIEQTAIAEMRLVMLLALIVFAAVFSIVMVAPAPAAGMRYIGPVDMRPTPGFRACLGNLRNVPQGYALARVNYCFRRTHRR
jgi:hypothetical protein